MSELAKIQESEQLLFDVQQELINGKLPYQIIVERGWPTDVGAQITQDALNYQTPDQVVKLSILRGAEFERVLAEKISSGDDSLMDRRLYLDAIKTNVKNFNDTLNTYLSVEKEKNNTKAVIVASGVERIFYSVLDEFLDTDTSTKIKIETAKRLSQC